MGTLNDCFVVYSHLDDRMADPPERIEHELTTCSTYEEASRFRQEFEREGQHCIIRFIGPTGGGD